MTPAALQQAMDASWPAATIAVLGPWCLRQGAGGGKRVSAATVAAAWAETDIAAAEAAMQAKGQRPLFLIGAEDSALDTALAARGYQLVDPVMAYAVPVDRVAQAIQSQCGGVDILLGLTGQVSAFVEHFFDVMVSGYQRSSNTCGSPRNLLCARWYSLVFNNGWLSGSRRLSA